MRRDTRKTWLLRGLAALILALTFGYLPYHLYGRSGFARYLRLRHDLAQIRVLNARLRVENERLSREARALEGDMRAVERVARAELGWVRPGEVVFDFTVMGTLRGSPYPPATGFGEEDRARRQGGALSPSPNVPGAKR